MSLPEFFVPDLTSGLVVLNEDSSKHIIGVLRMQKGDGLQLTNGKGEKAEATIVDDNRKKCTASINSITKEEKKTHLSIGISLVKNNSRFEWFLEKATEIGVSEILPMICERTEKEKFRFERMQQILISAMLQSQQTWLPLLHEPMDFKKLVTLPFPQKFIAHCLEEDKNRLSAQSLKTAEGQLILIGPEGDFTPAEVRLARENSFIPVSLGHTRLRTETAGIVAATLMAFQQ